MNVQLGEGVIWVGMEWVVSPHIAVTFPLLDLVFRDVSVWYEMVR